MPSGCRARAEDPADRLSVLIIGRSTAVRRDSAGWACIQDRRCECKAKSLLTINEDATNVDEHI